MALDFGLLHPSLAVGGTDESNSIESAVFYGGFPRNPAGDP